MPPAPQFQSEFLRSFVARGAYYDCSGPGELDALFQSERVTAYIGFDCTAKSMHIGNLVQLMTLRRLQQAGKGIAAALETIQAVVMKLVRQGDTSLRTQDVSLALLQETLAEARAGRRVAWDGAVPKMKEDRLSARQIDERFERETEEARRFAYGIAKEIKDEQD